MKQINFLQGCVFFIFKYEFLVGWGKNMIIYFKKNANIRGKRWKKGEKRKFLLYLGKKYDFRKKGRGAKISII